MAIYEKSCQVLMVEWLRSQLGPDESISRQDILSHMGRSWPKIKSGTVACHIIKLTTNDPTRIHYGAAKDSDVLYRVASGLYRLYRPAEDPPPVYKPPDGPPEDAEDREGQEFAYESDLRDFLAYHLELLEPGLKLYEEEGITGVEYPAGSRRIDILGKDSAGAYVVIEVKVSHGHERTVGQLAYYLSWVRENIAAGQPMRGMVVARNASEELKLALRTLPNVLLYHYNLNVTLTKVQ